MRFPWANVVLLILVLVQGVSGYFGFTNGSFGSRWLLWLHSIGGFGLVGVLFWKGKIILDVYRRGLGFDFRRLGFLFLTLTLLAIAGTGYFWTYLGPISLGSVSLVTWHILLAVGLLFLFSWHLWAMRFILRHPANRGRALFFRSTAYLFGGVVFWQLGDRVRGWLSLPGGSRRFTGSYPTGSPGQFPAYIWIADRPQPVQAETWRLNLSGELARPLHLTYRDLQALPQVELEAILDCTGGWYTQQVWRGVQVAKILDQGIITAGARSVSFLSVTGYERRFSIEEASGFLLATSVAGKPLEHGHGYPVRLVAPGKRGFQWVKWVTAVSVNATGPHWQSPLPLQ